MHWTIGLDREKAEHGKQCIVEDLSTCGFTIHDDVSTSTVFETLGGEADGNAGQIRMTKRRAWDLIDAFEHAANHVVSSDTMQRLIGRYDFIPHCSAPRMLNKREGEECLIFFGVYSFVV